MITASNISKGFKLYSEPVDRLKEIIFRKDYHKHYQALDDISFSLAAGETLGIIGPNGAGKSTLLKILTGILLPDSGTIDVQGRITALLELGTGFNMDLTGRKNIGMNGSLLGMDNDEIQAKEQLIIDFSGLGIFIDEPLSTYSSGMVMRLAFAIAINADPNCFIIDEALSVGDAGFQQKCMHRILEFKQQGGAIIFVSHDMNAVKQLCDRALLINKGTIAAQGKPDDIVNEYNRLLTAQQHQNNEFEIEETSASYGTLEAIIKRITINGMSQKQTLTSGDETIITVEIESKTNKDKLACGIIIRDKYGQDIYGTNTYLQNQPLSIKQGQTIKIDFKLALNIGIGQYTIGAAIHAIPTESPQCLNWVNNEIELEVIHHAKESFAGLCRLETQVIIRKP